MTRPKIGEQISSRDRFKRGTYKGKVVKENKEDGTWNVEYEDGDAEDLTLDLIQPMLLKPDEVEGKQANENEEKPAAEASATAKKRRSVR